MHNLTTDIAVGLSALSAVKRVFPSAIVAGGFLRDLHFGRSPKDVDIFVQYEDCPCEGGNLGGLNLKMVPGSPSLAPHELHCSFNLAGFDLPVQVMVLVPGLSVGERVSMFDFDFCQIWHDGWTLNMTPAFLSAAPHTVTLVECENQTEFARSMRRWKRLHETKYPDFSLVIPERYRPYQQNLEAA